jgi:quinol monooxygenase YgiN
MKTVLVEYTLLPDADVADVERRIQELVAGIRSLEAGIWYTSHRRPAAARSYTHVGFMPDDAALAKLQAAPFFAPFGQYLRTVTMEPPRVTWLEVVATTG